jgi:hypothetical protein
MPDKEEKQTLEERFLTEGVNYAQGINTFTEAIDNIEKLMDELNEDCHCCRMPNCECDE